MSNCDIQENIKKPIEDGPTMATTVAQEPIWDGLSITTVAAATVRTFFSPRAMGGGQDDALLTSTSLVWLMSLPLW